MPTSFPLEARAGDTFTRVLTWTDDDSTAYDLTGGSVEFSLKAGTTEYQYEDDAHASITDAAAGEVTLVFTPTETRALHGLAWWYEVTVTLVDTTRTTILEGILSVTGEVVA